MTLIIYFFAKTSILLRIRLFAKCSKDLAIT